LFHKSTTILFVIYYYYMIRGHGSLYSSGTGAVVKYQCRIGALLAEATASGVHLLSQKHCKIPPQPPSMLSLLSARHILLQKPPLNGMMHGPLKVPLRCEGQSINFPADANSAYMHGSDPAGMDMHDKPQRSEAHQKQHLAKH
jgi:hypothetical protein